MAILIIIGFVIIIIQGLYLSFFLTRTNKSTITKSYKSPKRPCNASWQVSVYGGNLYEVKCRNCGVRLESDGTPICRKVGDTLIP